MVNDAVSARKSKENDDGSSKKLSSGKNDASASGPDASGLRRSIRAQSNSSPVSLRKSQRLEKQTPPVTPPSSKKKIRQPSPLRRSVRESKSQSSSSKGMAEKGSPSSKGLKQQNKGSNTSDSSKDKIRKPDKTLKEIAQEFKDKGKQNCSSEVGKKKRKILNAKRYREMFKPLKKSKTSESNSDVKSRLENYVDSGDSDSEKVDEEEHEHSDEEELKGNCTKDTEGDVGDSNSCEIGDGEDPSVSRGHNARFPSSPKNEAVQISDQTEEVPANGSVMESLPNQEMLSASNKLSDNVNDSGFSQKGISLGASAFASEDMGNCSLDVTISSSSLCQMSIFAEECAKCLRKRRVDHDSPEQLLCCCLSNIVNDMDDYKDRGQCGTIVTAEFAEELGRYVKQSDSLLDVQQSMCVTCKLPGKLLQCSGKRCGRSFHPSCSLNPEKNIYLPNWYCSNCTKKRLALGVHSMSRGIESILDVREVDMSNTEGRHKQKQCFVKYKGLAHIHNRWVPGIHLVHEDPEFREKPGKEKKWAPVLARPHRLLQRRSIIINGKPIDQEVSLESNSQHEWLVKWCGLDYDQATWEPEDSSFFKKPEAQRLIEEYETRHNKARKTPQSGSNEAQEKTKDPPVKIGKLMVGGAESRYLNFVNKLREYHNKGHNAVLLDEQDRFVKVIHLVSSLVTHVSRPFLIISPYASLPSWEAEFAHVDASINVVVYGGNADARNIIRSLEVYEEGSQVMLQVLLSSAEAVAEDVEELKGIGWEAVIIDDCQLSCILAHSGCIMNLSTCWRLLLMNAQLKDDTTDYYNILSLLDPGCSTNQNKDINVLKDRLSSFIVFARFLEYWVPVEISNIQLERYCYSILSEFPALRSFTKSDPMGSLRNILISLRKCCDHPYIVDWQLQASLAKGISQETMTEVDIRASGKLHLLEKLLSELKNQKLKVLILFQSTSGSGRDTSAFVLEDLLRLRFGEDSYEYVPSGLVSSKMKTTCKDFNSLRERSFFLLETRACSPIIKLSLVDAVILFDSDWNPHNDLRALQKITIDSKLEQIKVFRLYCPCTVEEKVLILAKNDTILDSTLQSIVPITSQKILMWGSSNLFSRLDEFHRDKTLDFKDNIVFGSSFLTDVGKEIVALFQNRTNIYSSKYISLARQNGGCYLKCIPLIGEQKIQQEEVLPHDFWTKLLEGKQPQWKYLSGSSQSSQRNRKRVRYSEELPLEAQSDEAGKRRRKMDGTKIDSSSQQAEPRMEKTNSGNNDHQEKSGSSLITNSEAIAKNDPSFLKNIGPTLSSMTIASRETTLIAECSDLPDEQIDHFELLKPTMLNLCEALQLEDEEKGLVERFLLYLVKNYRVTRMSETTLQAFLLSVCWTASEEVKNKIDHKKSLTIATEKVGFNCSECEAENIYSMVKPKMESYLCLGTKNPDLKRNSVESPVGNLKKLDVELEESLLGADVFEKYMKKVEKGCAKEMERLKNKHNEELEKFEISREQLKMKLETNCKAESTTIRLTYGNSSVGIDKLRALDNSYAKKREHLEREIFICQKELEARQKIEKDEEQKRLTGYMKRVKALGYRKLLGESYVKYGVNSQAAESIRLSKDSNGNVGMNGNLPKQQSSNREAIGSVLFQNLENISEQRVSCDNDTFTTSIENVRASKGPYTAMFLPKQPCARVGQIEKDTNQMGDVVVDNSTFTPDQPCAPTGKVQKADNQMDDGVVDASAFQPDQPCAPMGQIEKDTNQMDDMVVVDTNTFAPDQPCAPFGKIQKADNQIDDAVVDASMFPPDQPCAPMGQIEKDTNQMDDTAVDTNTFTLDQPCAPIGQIEVVDNQMDDVVVDASIFPPDQPCAPTGQIEKYTNQMDDVVVDASTFLPRQPCAPTGQTEKPDNQMDDVVVDSSTFPRSQPCALTGQIEKDTNQIDAAQSVRINVGSTTGPLLSPVGSLLEHPTADTSQGLGDESHNGVGEPVGHATETHNSLPLRRTSSLNCTNHMPSDIRRNEGTSSSNEASFNDWVTHYNDQMIVAPNGRLHIQPFENHITPRHQDQNNASNLGEAVSQPLQQLSVHPAHTNPVPNERNVSAPRGPVPVLASYENRVQVSGPTFSWVPTSNHFDPLQNELDRMRKEIGNIMIIHEQKKLQLKSECDKEIEELVAQIRRKYNKKLDEAESSFMLKKNELEICQDKVVRHKMLAEAFRSKCTDYKAATRTQQLGNPSSSAESSSQLHSTRPLAPAGPVSATPLATGPTSIAPPVRGVRASTTLGSYTRISHDNPVAPPTGQFRREAHATAPHMQPFRPASLANSSSSMPSGDLLVAQPPNNPTSASAPQLPSQATPLNLSLSATQLIMDITRRHDANHHQISSNGNALPENVRNSESATNLQPTSSNVAEDVVCLSDDD
ncbi:hypothetical protein SOVF_160460 isoform B [Spinacia oleracea]|nr:hypothetical protein SOVF_160460 isoform B [Spinacia oleracea]